MNFTFKVTMPVLASDVAYIRPCNTVATPDTPEIRHPGKAPGRALSRVLSRHDEGICRGHVRRIAV